MNSSIYRGILAILAFGICGFAAAFAQIAASNSARTLREEQQRAMNLAQKLLDDNLNILLRQFEENGLTNREDYLEIVSLNRNLSHLVGTDMKNIVQRLADSNQVLNEIKSDSTVSIRKQISDVVRQLSIERQVILKRLRIVELATRLKELIQLQKAARDAAIQLLTDRHRQQESFVLQTIEDQRNVKESYLIFVDIMDDVRQWTGPWSAVAADGLRVLKVAKVGHELDEAGRSLQSLQFAKASEVQTRLLKSMQALLAMVSRASGILESSDLASVERIRALIDLQTRIRDATRSLIDLQQPTAEMIDEQSKIHQEVIGVQTGLPESTMVRSHAHQAETFAFEAAAKLLSSERDAAVADQSNVIEHLLAMERTLADIAQQSNFRSASQMARLVSNLSSMEIKIREVHAKHDSAFALGYQQHAAAEAKTVADLIRYSIHTDDLPSPIPATLIDLADATDDQAAKLSDPAIDLKSDTAEKSSKLVRDAYDKTEASIVAAIQDAKRRESALVIGELARTAEVLERLAAEEGSIKDVFQSQVGNPGESDISEIAKTIADRHAEVIAIANKLILATEETASTVSQPLRSAVQILDRSKANLIELAGKEAGFSSDQMIHSSNTALEASKQFGEAAKLIRREIANTATQLNRRMMVRADELSKTEQEVVSTSERSTSNDKLAQLESARSILKKAFQKQASVFGKPDVSKALQLESLLDSTIEIQDEVDSMILNLEAGETLDIHLVSKQADLSDRLQTLIDLTTKNIQTLNLDTQQKWASVTQKVSEAHRDSTDAARQFLDGDPSAAAISRASVRTALTDARKRVVDQITDGMQKPGTGIPDTNAQSEVTALIQSLQPQKLSSKELTESLRKTALVIQEAENAKSPQAKETSESQAKLWSALQSLDQEFAAEIRNVVTQRATDIAGRAHEFELLARRISRVESVAGEAVKAAERQAHRASLYSDSARRMQLSANQIEMALTRAATDLGVAEQISRQDAELADSIVEQIEQQQNAAEIIAQRAAVLERSDTSETDDQLSSTSRRKSAKELENAQQRFVEALRATGQAAVELSRQTEVANVPLREALAMASNLRSNAASIESLPDQDSMDQNAVSTDTDPLAQGNSDTPNDSAAGEKSAMANIEQRDDRSGGKSSQGSKSAKSREMGTGFVSQSADLTAEMMAGLKAQREAKKTLEQQLPVTQHPADDTNTYSNTTEDGDGGESIASENSGESKLSKKEGAATRNQRVKGGGAEKQREGTEAPGVASSKTREKEERISGRRFHEDAWFAKLPPDVQRSIRAGTAQKLPKAYEERLKKYFQSTD